MKFNEIIKIINEKKDPLSDLNFEKKFINQDINKIKNNLNIYDLDKAGITPVIKNDKIIGFVYDSDNDDTFKNKKINDMGLEPLLDFYIYKY